MKQNSSWSTSDISRVAVKQHEHHAMEIMLDYNDI
jgi:hypothetical protein